MKHVDLIEKLGGTYAVAKLVGVKPPSVSAWKERGVIPDAKLTKLAVIAEERGVANRQDLRPNDWQDIWPELATTEASA